MPSTSHSATATLLQLLPTYSNSTLPKSLVELATSLYASSRARAPVLKREEEIAREYACAVLAVDRLKAKLNLPDIDRRPPCPARAFAKLLKFLDGALVASGGSTANTPSKRPSAQDYEGADQTPTKRRKVDASSPAVKHDSMKHNRLHLTQGESSAQDGQSRDSSAPPWLPDFLVDVASVLSAPPLFISVATAAVSKLVPKSESGSSISTLPKKPDPAQQRIPALVIVSVLLTLERLGHQFIPRDAAKAAVKELIVRRIINMVQFGKVVAEAEALIEERGPTCRKMSWYQDANLGQVTANGEPALEPDSAMHEAPAHLAASEETHSSDSRTRPRGVHDDEQEHGQVRKIEREMPRGGLSTMLQPRVDWLSPERRLHYANWKEKILRRIATLEQEVEDPA